MTESIFKELIVEEILDKYTHTSIYKSFDTTLADTKRCDYCDELLEDRRFLKCSSRGNDCFTFICTTCVFENGLLEKTRGWYCSATCSAFGNVDGHQSSKSESDSGVEKNKKASFDIIMEGKLFLKKKKEIKIF